MQEIRPGAALALDRPISIIRHRFDIRCRPPCAPARRVPQMTRSSADEEVTGCALPCPTVRPPSCPIAIASPPVYCVPCAVSSVQCPVSTCTRQGSAARQVQGGAVEQAGSAIEKLFDSI